MRHPRSRARLASAILAAVVVAGCGTAPVRTAEPRSSVTGPPTPEPALGLTWATADEVERPESAFALPSPTAAAARGAGRSGHPEHFPGQSMMDDVVSVEGGLVAVGYTYPGWVATGWTSSDARHWRLVEMSADEATFPVAVASGRDLIVAVGRHGVRPAAWVSRDGLDWEEQPVAMTAPVGEAQRMTAVLAAPEGFVAGGSSGPELGERRARFWRSTDGRTWQPLPDDPALAGAEVTDIVAAADGLVAVGLLGPANRPSGSVAWVSQDGAAWARVDSPELASGRAVALTTSEDGWIVAVGSDLDEREALTWRSRDGLTWQLAPREASRYLGGRKVRMTDVTRVGSLLVGVGNYVGLQFGTASSWVSRDGLSWTRSTDTPAMEQGELSAVVPGGPGLVSVGTFGAPDNYIPRVWLSPGLP